MQKWLDSNSVMHWTHNKGKLVITERFKKKTLKAKIYKNWEQMIANLILLIWINQ